MIDVPRRILWFFMVVCAVGIALFLIVGNILNRPPAPIVVRDVISAGRHQLIGTLTVPTSCDDLVTPRIEQTDATTYMLVFQTWREPSSVCTTTPTSKDFRVVAFAPERGVKFTANLNGADLPIIVSSEFPSSR